MQEDLDFEIQQLKELTKASNPYTGMAIQRIRPVFEGAGLELLQT